MFKNTHYAFALLLLAVVGCGGGSSSEPPANQAPSANASADFNAVEATQVTLDGSNSSDADGSIASYTWTQTAGEPSVTLSNASSATASFTAPTTDSNLDLTFQLTVTDDEGESASDTVVVTITPDQAPVAVAPADFEAVKSSNVNLDGSASTDDVAIVTYLWQQTSGENVTLSNADTATASFTAPDLLPLESKTLTFSLTVTDVNQASSTDNVTVTIVETPSTVSLSGRITFDLVPIHTSTNGLDYASTTQEPVRGATVELLNQSGSTILQTTTSDSNGDYSFDVDTSSSYVVRVKAEMLKTGTAPTWNFTVVDNTSSQAIYAMQSDAQAVASSSVVLNLHADSGWGGTSYTTTRTAAPFAILDSTYQAKEKVLAADPDVQMAALKLNWSINNKAVSGNKPAGDISTSHFDGTDIYILGDANSDTDEYDDHVIIHEWGHYFEGRFSRSDSLGGAHSGGDKLDMRVALGEGFGNALSGIVTDDPFYRDSYGASQSNGFSINVETNPSSTQGWYNESSVQSLLYDIYDDNNDGSDNISIGFTPIYNALVNAEKNTEAFTSIYTLATAIKAESSANTAAIDSLMNSQNIIVNDEYGTGETNNGGDARNLPVYTQLNVGGSAVSVCSYDTNGQYNKLGVRKLLRFTIATTGSYAITVTGQSSGDDPDIYIYQAGTLAASGESNGNESFNATLSAGNYVADVSEYANVNGSGKDTCINVTIASN
jgi:hypothetical protein